MTKIEKYMFDLNNFDEPEIEEPEVEDIPPPPTFSEEELEQAKKEAFDKGKKEGIKESKESRDEYIGKILEEIKTQFEILRKSEQERNAVFEKEAVSLCSTILSHSFSYIESVYGLQETMHIIEKVLNSHLEEGPITIDVCPDEKDDIEEKIKEFSQILPEHYIINSSPNLSAGACKISWKNGGAVRNPTKMAEEIQKKLKETLAETADKKQNHNVKENGENHEQ